MPKRTVFRAAVFEIAAKKLRGCSNTPGPARVKLQPPIEYALKSHVISLISGPFLFETKTGYTEHL